jgi:hypothetical protein
MNRITRYALALALGLSAISTAAFAADQGSTSLPGPYRFQLEQGQSAQVGPYDRPSQYLGGI